MIPDRVRWLLHRATWAKTVPGFSASLLSYATADCQFEGNNRLAGHSFMQLSSLGRFSYLSSARLNNAKVGRFCSIGYEALVGLGDHPANWLSSHPAFYARVNPSGSFLGHADAYFPEGTPVQLGHDVWIGARAVVLAGVTVGHGAIGAAGALVTRAVAAFEVVAGVPAWRLRARFGLTVDDRVLQSAWWDRLVDARRALATRGLFNGLSDDRRTYALLSNSGHAIG